MSKIFQRFDLNLEAIANLSKEEQAKYDYITLLKLRKELKSKGYEILESARLIGSIPFSILVGVNVMDFGNGDPLKDTFYKVALELGLLYRSVTLYNSY